MPLNNAVPYSTGSARVVEVAKRRKAQVDEHTTGIGSIPETTVNGDEDRYANEAFPVSFTKGLEHDEYGFVTGNYQGLVTAINGKPPRSFAALGGTPTAGFSSRLKDGSSLSWRGWESPRTGHYFDTQGPDADAVGMAPAPALGEHELSGEMAELYAMAMLRDVPFTKIVDGTGADPITGVTVAEVLDALTQVPYLDPGADLDSPGTQARRRRMARTIDPTDPRYDIDAPPDKFIEPLTSNLLFRGSGPGAKVGPFVSQFMLVGENGEIGYGTQGIGQKVRVFQPGLDYVVNWGHWLDVQNGANFRGRHVFATERRFLTTPRDLATYVRFDELYQAYLNASLILNGVGFPVQKGFPDNADSGRTGFASFGGPHILTLVTEVATRCLRAVRRQKFNCHRRARPERIAGLLTVANAVSNSAPPPRVERYGEETEKACGFMLEALRPMLHLVACHNKVRALGGAADDRPIISDANPAWLKDDANLLLAMAFPEGSPMHPSYGAGHATVAGGCITMLKAFFDTIDVDVDGGVVRARPWSSTGLAPVVANETGSELVKIPGDGMTVEGELNKLAANIAIARDMAGVHYYSDYYDSVRMGERVAVGILLEQMHTYDESVKMVFRSFDGDVITLATDGSAVTKEITNAKGAGVSYADWFHRHR